MRAAAPRTIPLSRFGLMTVREVAAYHRVSWNTAWSWIHDGRIPRVPVSRGVLVSRADCVWFVPPQSGRPRGTKNKPTQGAKKPPARRAAVVIPLSEFGLMTVAEVAVYHRRKIHAVWCWVARGLLPAVELERGVLIPRSDCEAFEPPKHGHRRKRTAPAGRMTPAEVARYHGCTDRAVVRWIAKGRLPAVATSSGYLVRRSDCKAFKKPQPGRPLGSRTRAGKGSAAGGSAGYQPPKGKK